MEGGENEVRRCLGSILDGGVRPLESICTWDPRFLLQRWLVKTSKSGSPALRQDHSDIQAPGPNNRKGE